MKISISNNISNLCEGATLGILIYSVNVMPSSTVILKYFEEKIAELEKQYTLEMITQNKHIAATRAAYKALGKSPHEYRNAAEAMLRRIVKGNGLYNINNVVEINNIISVSSGYSVGSYDLECLEGDIEWRHAPADTHYDGIGKGSVNIGNLPVLFDELGPFGNPTSDSRRAMVLAGEKKIISVVYSFDGKQELEAWMSEFKRLLSELCGATHIEIQIIG